MVLITGFQHHGFLKELVRELLTHPRDVDIVDIDEIKLVCPSISRHFREDIP